VTLSFFERRQKQVWFSTTEERLTWEQWCARSTHAPLCVTPPNARRRADVTRWRCHRRLHVHLVRPPASADSPASSAAAEERAARHAALETALSSALVYILRTVNERKEHIPPVVSGGVVSFPFDIALPPEEGGYGVETLRRLVTAVRPPMNVL
jgi:autophagy-related protein 101